MVSEGAAKVSFSPVLRAPPLVVLPSASLPLNVELVMVAAELLLMAPPLPSPVPVAGPTAWLSKNAQWVTVSKGPGCRWLRRQNPP